MRDLAENVEMMSVDVVRMRSQIKTLVSQIKVEDSTHRSYGMRLSLEMIEEHLEQLEAELDHYYTTVDRQGEYYLEY